MLQIHRMLPVLFSAWLLSSCNESTDERVAGSPLGTAPAVKQKLTPPNAGTGRSLVYSEQREPCSHYDPHRLPLFGDLHVHTALSFDAVAGRINTLPEGAHRFAMGEPIPFFPQDESGAPGGSVVLKRPLDFLAVTDHSEFLGERELCTNPKSPSYQGEFCAAYREVEFKGTLMLASVLSQTEPKRISMLCGEGDICLSHAERPWRAIVEAAEAAYDRTSECRFTSFVGYEYTGTPENSNYHRNVIFRNGNAPPLPVSYVEAPFDYLLWKQLDAECNNENNCDYMTIPHNSNMSNGRLLTPYANMEPSRANKSQYAKARLAREPLMEIFQHKGASECTNGLDPMLGAADELCNFEQVRFIGVKTEARNFYLDGVTPVFEKVESETTTDCGQGQGSLGMFSGGCVSKSDFLRTALLVGLEEEQSLGLNPVKLGVIASTDGHAGTPGSVKEDEWQGYVSGEMTTINRLKQGTLPSGIKGNPGGLAGVWAVENSRDAIFNALQRRETFGTSGPRIAPRFFGGWDFPAASCETPDMVSIGYSKGVPMGGDLPLRQQQKSPTFIAAAQIDSGGANTPLKMLQIVKGWTERSGRSHYKVYTVAGSPDSNAGVDVERARPYGQGHSSLCVVFTDPDFDPESSAYYYLRVVENPSPRWSLYDCLSLAESARPEICTDTSRHVINEMAWTSPIWYNPATD